jgi:hypothetical protein
MPDVFPILTLVADAEGNICGHPNVPPVRKMGVEMHSTMRSALPCARNGASVPGVIEQAVTDTGELMPRQAKTRLCRAGTGTCGRVVTQVERSSRVSFIESERLCTVFPRGVSDPVSGSGKHFLRQTRRPTYILEEGARPDFFQTAPTLPKIIEECYETCSRSFSSRFVSFADVFCRAESAFHDDRRPNQSYGAPHDRWQGRLSTEDQGRFDSYYSRWLNYTQTNDAANRNDMEERMRDVMSHYDIPSDVSFDRIASNSNGRYRVRNDGDEHGQL